MSNDLFPVPTIEINEKRVQLAPHAMEAWRNFSRTIYKEGVLPEKTKQLIAVAVAHATQCGYCIRSHTKQAMRKGASQEEIMEAIWVAAEMRAGAAVSHSALAIDEMLDAK
jgi:AhpD family alkylhydroperoxidase